MYTINDYRSLLIILYYINAVGPVKRVLETCWRVLSTDSLGQTTRRTTTTRVFNKIIIIQNTCVVVQLLLLSLCILCALVLIAAIKHHCVLLLLFSKNHYRPIVCVCSTRDAFETFRTIMFRSNENYVRVHGSSPGRFTTSRVRCWPNGIKTVLVRNLLLPFPATPSLNETHSNLTDAIRPRAVQRNIQRQRAVTVVLHTHTRT